ncbi:MAG: PCMD domain-containing protein [Bacteroidetes bacterium]|uniref:PCMD domain-containing protein n=1 Tax=Candidatus Cryptobacteroides faecigallinarum TaxID=2840763 RepID=A0A9D9INF0_9BACT|nr:PCMD domain-containing protein [Candidatus Cryptobacteroides faecigallinarum]
MKKIRHIIMAILTLPVLSCTQTVEPEGYGYVDIDVRLDRNAEDIEFDAVSSDVSVKSTGESSPIALAIYRSGSDEPVEVIEDCASVLEPLKLKTGHYKAVATCGESLSEGSAAAFDSPFYSDTETFVIKNGVSETLDMTLVLDAVKVTTKFSEEIRENFKSYVLTVSNGVSELVFSNLDGTVDRDGYFAVTGTLEWSLALTNNDGEVYETLTGSYEEVKPKQHYAISFRMAEKQPEGGAVISIVVDDSMTEKVHDILLDFSVKDKPEISASFSLDSPLSFHTGDAAEKILYVNLKHPATSVLISHDDEGLAAAGLPEEIELVNASEEILSSLAGLGITAPAVTEEVLNPEIDLTGFFSTLPAGTYGFEVFVQNNAEGELLQEISFEVKPVVETLTANAWARFAYLSGRWLTEDQPEGLGFQYRTGDEEWTNLDADVTVNAEAKTFEAELHGLAAGTQYEYRAVTAAFRENQPVQFTTETEDVLHNMGFDQWYMDGKAPMPNASADYMIWDSANPGSASFGIVPTTQETSHLAVTGENKSAAKLTTLSVPIVGLAAGNIYTGRFEGTVGGIIPSGAALDWGVPFSSRPLALKGFYDYTPKTVNQGSYNDMSGKTDIGQIQIMLTDWDQPSRIDTSEGTFVDVENDGHIIAYASLDLGQTDGYQPFTLELEYRDRTRTPKYIVIVAAASKYGDYFTGGVDSTLYLDEFSFVYDPAELGYK